MRLFVQRVDYSKHRVSEHIDTHGDRCQIRHEFYTRGCRPIIYSEDWVRRNPGEYVELTTMDRQTDLLLSKVI